MTIKSKTFYVCNDDLELLKRNIHFQPEYLQMIPNIKFHNEIQISWKEPRKVTISEEEFDEVISKFPNSLISTKILKQSLFGDE